MGEAAEIRHIVELRPAGRELLVAAGHNEEIVAYGDRKRFLEIIKAL